MRGPPFGIRRYLGREQKKFTGAGKFPNLRTYPGLQAQNLRLRLALCVEAPLIMRTILLLLASNVFMTLAWYGHLKIKAVPLIAVIAVSWLIAFPEYCLAVPANRLGHISQGGPFSAPQLKILQEAISILVFLVFTLILLKEVPRWQDLVAFALIFAGLAVALWPRTQANQSLSTVQSSREEKVR